VLMGHNWLGPTLVSPAHGLAAHCLEQGSAHGGADRWRPAHPVSRRWQPVGESVEEQHKGGWELGGRIKGSLDTGFTRRWRSAKEGWRQEAER
jgi:hypothetical protein